MLLSDVFDSLAYGELSALSLATNGQIDRADMPRLVNIINRGVLDLHKKFTLKRGVLTLKPDGSVRHDISSLDKTAFEVLSIHGESATPSIFEVEQVNHPKYLRSDIPLCYMLMSPTIIRFNHPLNESITYTVEYKAGPTPVVVSNFETVEPHKVEVDLPIAYLEALSLFVASRVIAPIANNLGNPQESMNYQAMYEQACQALTVQGLDVEEVAHDQDRFYRNGFI